eukprot:6195511-Pleurochrysis_carterae.AAC.3
MVAYAPAIAAPLLTSLVPSTKNISCLWQRGKVCRQGAQRRCWANEIYPHLSPHTSCASTMAQVWDHRKGSASHASRNVSLDR